MPTGVQKGLTFSRVVGAGGSSVALAEYTIASGYATALAKGDPVKLASDGTIELATNNSADSIGVFEGLSYTDSNGKPQFSSVWAASTTGTNIKALVIDHPMATFKAKAEGPIPLVQRGDIFALTIGTPNAYARRSEAVVKTNASLTGDVDLDPQTDIGENVAGVADNDAFTIKTSQATTATTITIEDGDGAAELLVKLNAVDNISAALDATTGFLVITATDGYDIVAVESTNTPFVALMGVAAGTFSEVVAASAGLVKVIQVLDEDSKLLEVILVDHDLRDDG